MDKSLKSAEVYLGRQGRLVIPAALRRLLELEEGDKLMISEEGGRLVLEKQETIKQSLKSRFAKVPKDRSLANELIAQRREAAKEEVTE
ncbi:MAG: AbrB/MazE/SpoVT family DNA-binding domain-containing protein [Cyanobacteria bacterium]|nr:AbrB/MazE/SpoVT family DNA-binding domain-containing protein [Cyanobacteria bacterium GSL.Bin1]